MKLVVFGAGGGTGNQIVEQALTAGHEVTAFAHHPSNVTTRHERLDIAHGDVLEPSTVEEPVSGTDVVVSALGSHGRGPTTVYSEEVGNIMQAMQETDVGRLVCISSDGLDADHPNVPFYQRFVTKHIVQRLYRHVFADMTRMEEQLSQSNLEWTVIRAPMLTDGPRTSQYRATVNESIPRPEKISRADLADYIVPHLADAATYRMKVEISY
jgi:putative NADH-flavin reductase